MIRKCFAAALTVLAAAGITAASGATALAAERCMTYDCRDMTYD
jgi:hypothetical protein